jgi:dTDP-4-dehydrorhamnose 3,5-epimerase
VIFTETPLAGAYTIEIEPHADERGFFARTTCSTAFAKHGLNGAFVQQSVSFNAHRGTLRGLHLQAAPYEEDKLVRVTRGCIFDVIVDIRPGSAGFGQWFGVELSAQNHRQIYIPKGFAHGFQTLEDNCEVLYAMTVPYQPGAGRGIRWNDPDVAIAWPMDVDSTDRQRMSVADSQNPQFAGRKW